MRKTIEVVDSFYRNPTAMREIAIGAEWSGSPDVARTHRCFPSTEARDVLADVTGWRPREHSDFGYFAFLGDGAGVRPETDVAADWAVVVYLTAPERCSGGISFYSDETAKEETAHIPMVFNRMVLLHASQLTHRARQGFGSSPDQGRLTQVFLFSREPA